MDNMNMNEGIHNGHDDDLRYLWDDPGEIYEISTEPDPFEQAAILGMHDAGLDECGDEDGDEFETDFDMAQRVLATYVSGNSISGLSYEMLLALRYSGASSLVYWSGSTPLTDVMEFMREFCPDATVFGRVVKNSNGEILQIFPDGVKYYGEVTKGILLGVIAFLRGSHDITIKDRYLECWFE